MNDRRTKAQLLAEIARLERKAAVDGEGFALQNKKILQLEENLSSAEISLRYKEEDRRKLKERELVIASYAEAYLAIKDVPEDGYSYICDPPEEPIVVEQGIRLARAILKKIRER